MGRFPEKPTVESILSSSTLLNGLSPDDFTELKQVCRIAKVDRGEIIWLAGSEVDFFGLVGTGFVKMVRSTASGQEVTAEIMGPGQIFGMLGVIEGPGCPLSARGVCPTWYARIPRNVFMPIYRNATLLKEHMVHRITRRLREAHDMIAKLATGRVEERIAAVLIMLAGSYGVEDKDGVTLNVPLTRQDIGEMAGTTTETTIRIMSRWQKDHIVTGANRKVIILDVASLQRISSGVPF